MTIKKQIEVLLELTGLSQEKLARELGVSFATLNSWVNGRSKPRALAARKIQDWFLKLSGEASLSRKELEEKLKLILLKKRKYPNPLGLILRRPDLRQQFVLSLTYNSNKIEGSTLTEDETASVLFDNQALPNKTFVEQLEAKNHETALNFMFQNDKGSLGENWILKVHSILMNGIRSDAGLYRQHGVRIVGSFVPTANYLKVPRFMKDFEAELNRKNAHFFEGLALIHAHFEKIHPFSDGNGRIGRILLNASLLNAGFPPALIREEKRRLYYTYLRKAQLDADASLLEDFIMDAVLEAYSILE